jgi:hypothetical protein
MMRRIILLCAMVLLSVFSVVVAPGTAGASGQWRPAIVLVPHPAGTVEAGGAYGADGLLHGFTTDRGGTILYLQGTGARWSRSPSPYRGSVLATAVEGRTTYVLFGERGYVRLGVRTAAGRYLPTRQISPKSGALVFPLEFTGAALLVRNGHWRAFWTGNAYLGHQLTISGVWTRADGADERALIDGSVGIASRVAYSIAAAWLPDGRAALLVAAPDNPDSDAPPAMQFGVGGSGAWTFAPLNWPGAGASHPQLVSRYARLYAVWAVNPHIYTAHYDGRTWSAPATSPELTTGPGVTSVRQSISLGQQFISWSDATGMYAAERGLDGGHWARTLLNQAGSPTLDVLSANRARATVIYTISLSPTSRELRTRQQ